MHGHVICFMHAISMIYHVEQYDKKEKVKKLYVKVNCKMDLKLLIRHNYIYSLEKKYFTMLMLN
jgi:hypothetical protein